MMTDNITTFDPFFKPSENGFYKGRVTGKNIIVTDDIDVHDALFALGADVVYYGDINILIDNALEQGKNIRIITQSTLTKGGDKKYLVKMPENPTLEKIQALFVEGGMINLVRASDVKAEPIKWLWDEWLPLGKLTTLAGAGGSGKTTIVTSLIATITTGGTFPDGKPCQYIGECIIYSTEDDIADTLIPRLMACGADLSKVYFIDSVTEKGKERYFDASEDLDKLYYIASQKNIKLVLIDPILAVVNGDMNKANEVRASLNELVKFASSFNCAVIGITHFAKGTKGQDPTERVIGSQAFTALARMNWVTAPSQEPDQPNIFTKHKTNIAKIDGGFGYFIEPFEVKGNIKTTRIKWGDFRQGSARQLLKEVETIYEEKEPNLLDQAKQFLMEILRENGKMKAKEIQQQAKEADITPRTLRRAREEVCERPIQEKDGWYWQLKSAYLDIESSLFIDLKNQS